MAKIRENLANFPRNLNLNFVHIYSTFIIFFQLKAVNFETGRGCKISNFRKIKILLYYFGGVILLKF